jgi:hypothetical protein
VKVEATECWVPKQQAEMLKRSYYFSKVRTKEPSQVIADFYPNSREREREREKERNIHVFRPSIILQNLNL